MDHFEDDLERLAASGLQSARRRSSTVGSVDSGGSEAGGLVPGSGGHHFKTKYRVLVMGNSRVGKTSIISQFLYDQFSTNYKATVEEMYRGEFEVGSTKFTLDIEDTSGTFAWDFPAMVEVSLGHADAVLLVFAVDDRESFEQIAFLRDMVMKTRGQDMPIVIVGNKTDRERDREMEKLELETVVQCDWENGYVECSARLNQNISNVFKELLNQARSELYCLPTSSSTGGYHHSTHDGLLSAGGPSLNMRRRQSLPIVPVFNKGDVGVAARRRDSRRGSVAAAVMGRQTCKIS